MSQKWAIIVLLVCLWQISPPPGYCPGYFGSTVEVSEGVNFSDPLAYEVDYGLMCLLSLYQAEMAWSSENDPEIQAVTFLIAVLQTAVSVAAGRLAQPQSVLAGAAGGAIAAEIANEVVSELVIEQFFSTLASWAGAAPFWSEFVIGEVLGNALDAGKLLSSAKNFLQSVTASARGVVRAADALTPLLGAALLQAASIAETMAPDGLTAALSSATQTAAASRTLGAITPAVASLSLGAVVARMEAAIVDASANCRVTAAARAAFLSPGGATFTAYPGTLLDGHQMAVVACAAALVHPTLPVTDLLALPSLQALFGLGGATGRGQLLQVAVKGLGAYTFTDAGEVMLNGEVQTLAEIPSLLDLAFNPNAGPLQFVDPPRTSSTPRHYRANKGETLPDFVDRFIATENLQHLASAIRDINQIKGLTKFERRLLAAVALGQLSEGGTDAFDLVVSEPRIRSTPKGLRPVWYRQDQAHGIILDILVRFRSGRGFSVEGQGYGESGYAFGHSFPYGPVKDLKAAALLEQGFATIYVAYATPSEAVYQYYVAEGRITTIGRRAPLLTEAMFGSLMQLLADNPGIDLKVLLLNLHKESFQITLNNFNLNEQDILNLQTAFGIQISFNQGVISEIMSQWWTNYDYSNEANIPYLEQSQWLPNGFYALMNYFLSL